MGQASVAHAREAMFAIAGKILLASFPLVLLRRLLSIVLTLTILRIIGVMSHAHSETFDVKQCIEKMVPVAHGVTDPGFFSTFREPTANDQIYARMFCEDEAKKAAQKAKTNQR